MRKMLAISFLIALIIVAILGYYSHNHNRVDPDFLTLYGNVDVRQVDISFRVLGRVVEMPFEEGDLVHTGDLMGSLEKQPYQDQVKQAEAQMASFKATLSNAEVNFKRRAELVGTQSVAKEDYENAMFSKDEIAENLKASEAALGIAKKNLNDTEVFAPTDGTILTRIREPGSVLNPGEPLYTLSILNPVWIRAFIAEPSLGKIHPGMTAEVYTDTGNGKVYNGRIGFISPVSEFTPKTVETTSLRTDLVYRLRIYVDNPDWGLRQGMPVTVKLDLRKK